tara:strand:- start:3114 stop:4538 length:1425 start_codon:yes stop_codon:yes gene_type:complete
MGIFNFFIDKRKTCKDKDYLDIILDYPIEITDYEYMKIKLVDFKFLNSIFNISSNLMNNQFNIRRYSKNYTFSYGGSELYFKDTGFYDANNVLLVNQVEFTNEGQTITTKTLTLGELSLIYRQDYQVSLLGWENILNDTADGSTRKMRIEKDDKWFEIISSDNNRIKTLNCVFYKDTYVSASTTDVIIKFQRFNTTTSAYEDIDSKTITFPNSVSQETTSLQTFTYSNPVATNKYRLICDTPALPFNLHIIKLQANKQIPVYDSGTLNPTPTETTITIPDGFYKASNLKTTLNTLLTPYNITTSIDTFTNKLKFVNNNNFSPTLTNLVNENCEIDLVIPNIENMKENFGIVDTYQEFIRIPLNSYYECDKYINLMNLSKIIITTNLNFQNKTHNEIIRGNNMATGIGNVLEWIDCDEPPFTCIKYHNYDDLCYKIENKHISSIRLNFYNEKSQPLVLDNALIHLQIKKLQKKSY